MRLPENIHLVRHGAYMQDSLIERGMEEAFKAGQALAEEGFDKDATIFSSPMPRVVQTAKIIGNVIGQPNIIYKDQLGRLDYVDGFNVPVDAIRILAEEEEIIFRPESKLAVITHEPLITRLLTEKIEVKTGSVHKLCTDNIPLLD